MVLHGQLKYDNDTLRLTDDSVLPYSLSDPLQGRPRDEGSSALVPSNLNWGVPA